MRWCLYTPGSAEYVLPITLSTSFTPETQYTRRRSLMMYMEAVIEWVWGWTWRRWSCKLGVHNSPSLEINLEAMIERVWRCTWRPWSYELGGWNCADVEIHLEAAIERGWRWNWRPWSSVIGGVPGGSQSRGGSSGGRRERCWDAIDWLTHNCGNVENWVQHGLPKDWLGAGDSRSWDDAVRGVCSTQCMLYSVYAVLGVIPEWWHGEQWLNFVFSGDGRVEDEQERDERRWGKSSWEAGT